MTFVFHCSESTYVVLFPAASLPCAALLVCCAIPVPLTNGNVVKYLAYSQHKPRDINLNWTGPLPCKRPCRHARYPLQQEQCRHKLFICRSVRAPSKFRLRCGVSCFCISGAGTACI